MFLNCFSVSVVDCLTNSVRDTTILLNTHFLVNLGAFLIFEEIRTKSTSFALKKRNRLSVKLLI